MAKGKGSGHGPVGEDRFWTRLLSELRTDVFSGKLDGILSGTTPKQTRSGLDKVEPPYSATPKIREGGESDPNAKRKRAFVTYEERRSKTIEDAKLQELAELCKNIRPGVKTADIDALAAVSDGMLSAQSLSDEGNWAPGQVPCKITIERAGDKVLRVEFNAGHYDPEDVGQYGTIAALLGTVPGARRGYQTFVEAKDDIEKVDLPTGATNIVARIHFKSGVFMKTEYAFEHSLKRFDEIFASHDAEKRKNNQAQKNKWDAYNALSLDEKLAKFRAPHKEQEALLGADGRLRDWAHDYSSWGENSNRWESFVNWLITKSTPDDRHYLVTGMNWDHGLEIFHWIIRQPDTDIATAAEIIWQGGVSYHVPESAKATAAYPKGSQLHGYDLLLETADRIRSKFFRPSPGHEPIGFEPHYEIRVDRSDPDIRAAEDRLMPSVVRSPIPGRPQSEVKSTLPEHYYDLLN